MQRENTREGIDAALNDFMTHMRHKLLLTRHRDHWKELPLALLLERVKEEVVELEEALASGDRKKVVRECADVANFLMFIADNEQWAGSREWDSHEGR